MNLDKNGFRKAFRFIIMNVHFPYLRKMLEVYKKLNMNIVVVLEIILFGIIWKIY